MTKAISCIGQGFVGGSLTTVFSEHGLTVYVHDKTGKVATGGIDPKLPDPRDRDITDYSFHSSKSIGEFVQACEAKKGFSGVYFVCVPTPMRPDGSADLSIVESVLNDLNSVDGHRIAVVKSTVPPGTTARWNIEYSTKGRLSVVFCPEFLTEANALDDMRNQTRIILGGPRPHINTVKQIFQSAFPKVPIVKTSSTTAEMVKYTTNCFLATKVSFANEIAQICEALDTNGMNVDYDKVVEYAKLDKRLGDSHWAVPGPVATEDGRYVRGYGGHCLAKDINALIVVANENGIKPMMLNATWQKNLELRPPEDRDWEKMGGRAVSIEQDKTKTDKTILYWSQTFGHEIDMHTAVHHACIDKETGPVIRRQFSGTVREWYETLMTVLLYAASKDKTGNIITIRGNNHVVNMIKSSISFMPATLALSTLDPSYCGSVGNIAEVYINNEIEKDIIYVGDFVEVNVLETSASDRVIPELEKFYWSKVLGHFVNKKTGKLWTLASSLSAPPRFTGCDREWRETLIEICIDARNKHTDNLVKKGQTNLPYKFPTTLLANSKTSEYLKSSVLFKENIDISGVSTGQVIGTIGSMFKIICDDCIADEVIYVGDFAEIYICDTSDQIKP